MLNREVLKADRCLNHPMHALGETLALGDTWRTRQAHILHQPHSAKLASSHPVTIIPWKMTVRVLTRPRSSNDQLSDAAASASVSVYAVTQVSAARQTQPWEVVSVFPINKHVFQNFTYRYSGTEHNS